MNTIKIVVRDKIAVVIDETTYICGNSDFAINFDFDAEWDKFDAKTARFSYEGKYQDVVFTGTECPVPIISNTHKIYVGVFAGNLHTTTPAYIPAKKSILCGSGSPEAPSEDVYAQIMEKINGMGGVTPEQVAAVVAEYMAKNPLQETDPTVPDWAKSEQKPDYTADEVGAAKSVDPTAYGLPVLSLTGSTEGISKDKEVSLEYVYGERRGSCTLKWQGSSSLSYPKKNYTIKFDSAFEAAEGWGEEKKYCLKANFIDFSHARNIVSARLWGEVVKSRSDYGSLPDLLKNSPNQGAVDGFPICLVLNDVYQGLYTWNIPKDSWMFGMGDGASECIMAANHHSAATRFETEAICDESDFEIEYVPDDNDTQWAVDSLNTLIRGVKASDGTNLDSIIANYADLNSAIDWYIFIALICGPDNYDKNYLLSTYDGAKWFFTPYDMDGTWGLSYDGNRYYNPISGIPTVKSFNHALIKLLVSFKLDAVKARYEVLRENVLSEANVTAAFCGFFAGIPKGLYDEEVKLWPAIPGSSANHLSQILNNYRLRVIEMDKQMAALEPEIVIPASMLKTQKTWYGGATDPATITQINFVTSYAETGNETEVFVADYGDRGTIKGYVNGTTLTVAPTNGARKINLHTVATNMFRDFVNVEEINGTEMFACNHAGIIQMQSAFNGLSKLTSKITLPEGVTVMTNAFNRCTSMTEPPNIPSTVTTLSSAFYGCSGLRSLPKIPGTVTGSGEYAFCNCTGVTSIDGMVVPEGITSMTEMFSGLKNVGNSTVTIHANPETYTKAFSNVAVDTGATVTLKGTSTILAELAATNTQGRVVVGVQT